MSWSRRRTGNLHLVLPRALDRQRGLGEHLGVELAAGERGPDAERDALLERGDVVEPHRRDVEHVPSVQDRLAAGAGEEPEKEPEEEPEEKPS